MLTNGLKRKLASGGHGIGTWLTLSDPIAAESLAQIGFEWVVIDQEHTPTDIRQVASIIQSVGRFHTVPLVRIGGNTEENIKRVLGAGAWGVVAPNVRSVEEARVTINAVKYPPFGSRSAGGARTTLSFDTDPATHFQRANDETMVVLQFEDIAAIDSLDGILSVPGVDAVYVGLDDLYLSMGLSPYAVGNEKASFEQVLQRVLRAARRTNVAAGIHSNTSTELIARLKEGWNMLGILGDRWFMEAAAKKAFAEIRERKLTDR